MEKIVSCRGGHTPADWRNICQWPTQSDAPGRRRRKKRKPTEECVKASVIRIPMGRSRKQVLENL